ncbi:MAG: hypothetical protein AAGC68_04940, partial [Verrucomicrobiota bacterium]
MPLSFEDGDEWYYRRIANRPDWENETRIPPASGLYRWLPSIQSIEQELEELQEEEKKLPLLRFELQGDHSSRYALFRCLDEVEGAFEITWRAESPLPVEDLFFLPTRAPQADGRALHLGFPERWQVIVSESGSFANDGEVVWETNDEYPGEGYPVRVKLTGEPIRAWRMRVEEPFNRYGVNYIALSEVFVISGGRNFSHEGEISWSKNLLPDRFMTPGFLRDEQTHLGLPLIREATEILG